MKISNQIVSEYGVRDGDVVRLIPVVKKARRVTRRKNSNKHYPLYQYRGHGRWARLVDGEWRSCRDPQRGSNERAVFLLVNWDLAAGRTKLYAA